jgi:GT2 family glycosyltransferase
MRWLSKGLRRLATAATIFPHSLRLRLVHSRYGRHRGIRFFVGAAERLFEKARRLPFSLRVLWIHRHSGLFDHAWYFQQNPDVRQRTRRPFLHFAFHGVFEGRPPHAGFDPAHYAEQNPDIAASGTTPLMHYTVWGWRENRAWRRPIATHSPASTEEAVWFEPISSLPASRSDSTATDIRAIALYLPQFHAIPENDQWWGKGFTEWNNVRRARPQFEGHHQPHIPHPDLGYYDLNDPTVLEKQAAMARAAGIEGFCFYYYWFDGRRLLEMPTDRMLASGKPDFPFCFCWANEDWTRTWDGAGHEILVGQVHSAESDARFIHDLLPAFRDKRYIRVDGKPLLVVYRPKLLPDPLGTARRWREACRAEGIGEIFLAYMRGFEWPDPAEIGFDAAIQFPPLTANAPLINGSLQIHSPEVFRGLVRDYRDMPAIFDPAQTGGTLWPCVCPSWDNTARRMEFAHSWANATPETYHRWLCKAVARLRETQPEGRRILFINAWNEWAEGCHLEPDEKHGYAWLNATRQALLKGSTQGTLDRHPPILAARRARLHFFLGRSTPPECEALLIHHTALLSIIHRRCGKLRIENERLSASMDGETFSLASTKDLARLAEKIWGPAESIPFCFVLLQFNNAPHTRQCVESIKRLNPHGHEFHIVIVDNASSAETVAATRSAFEGDRQVSLLFNKENLGFSRGNNLGYRLAKKRFGSAFVVAANNDVVFEDFDFLSKCADLYREHTYSVLGPDIVTPDGRHENPWNDHIYSLGEWRDLQALYRRQQETHNQTGRAEFQKTGERHPERALTLNPILQGACLVFSPVFVETHTQAFDESLFLYGEEFPLAVDCLLSGHLCVYSNAVAVRHEEGVSTGLLAEGSKMSHGYEGALQGIELALLRLERQADAIAGRAMACDPGKIRKLINDGRRHILVDLFFCQPGFHGGGEYGKAVFGGLAETAKSLPGVQLWVALDPDLFIDDWILEECRRSAIPIVRVKSYDEIAALVNLDAFHSFFAPAIVVYTGYEYMKRLGGELKFSAETKTKVVGTLLDLRDWEMAADWEAVAGARKNAGCLPEVTLSEKELSAEKLRQKRHAAELAAMYEGLCSHKSLHTLVTISDYSAQSIRTNAKRRGPIEVLFAPEKNRPAPEPFEWPGLDFQNDPFLVLLNAGRVEKNAASAVVAFDLLFSDPEFAEKNPRLKLVLSGIKGPADLGKKSLHAKSRLVAIPYLSPERLEFLLQNARGLLYPSFNEGFGYPPLEAMSLGIPVVASNRTSIPEVCGDTAVYCDPFDLESIAAAIRNLLARPADVESLKSHAEKIRRLQSRDLRRLSELICGAAEKKTFANKPARP